MRILKTPKELSDALVKLEVRKIAVAYVGQGWRKWLGGHGHQLGEIILSPTMGSNPYAIEEIFKDIGIDNVYFLDKLHAKLYVGDGGVLIGSPNLSDNGFGANGNREMAVFFEIGKGGDPADLEGVEKIFEKYKTEAAAAYPTRQSKLRKLKELHRNWQEASRRGLANEEAVGAVAPLIENWGSKLDRIHIVWWSEAAEPNYNTGAVAAALPEAKGMTQEEISSLFCEEFEFHSDDDIRVGDWILSWQCRKNYEVSTHFWRRVGWTYVDTVIPNGYVDEEYTKLAGTRSSSPSNFPHPPFALTSEVQKKILDLLASGDFPELLEKYGDPWLLGPADNVTADFLGRLQREFSNP